MLNRALDKINASPAYLLLSLWLLLIVTFASVIGADYVYFDEHVEILANPLITASLSLDSLWRIFTAFEANQYTPLSLASFWLEYNVFGFNSAVSHFINLLLHLGCATLVFYLAEFLVKKKLPAFLLAALWALHPLQVETVAWVLERRNLLYGLFYFASLLAYCRFLQTQRPIFVAYATLLMICSGLAKTLAFFLPFNWLMIDWLTARPLAGKLLREKAAALLAAAAMLAVMFLGARGSVAGSGTGAINFALAGYNISFYAAKALLPVNLSPTYEMHEGTEGLFAMGPLYFAILAAVALWLSLKSRLLAFALLFYFFQILPLSGLIRVGYKFYAVLHFMYLALFGLLLALVAGIDQVVVKEQLRRFFTVAALLIILIFAVMSHDYCQVWQNSQTLFTHCLEHDPNNRFARNQLAIYFETQGNLREAAVHFKELIERYPVFFGGYYGMGRIFMKLDQFSAALTMLDKAMLHNQKRADIPFDRGYVNLLLGRFSAAEADLSESLQLREHARTRFMRSESRRKQGDYLAAIDGLQHVVVANPYDFSCKISLFELFVESGRGMDALANLLNIVEQITENPNNWEEYRNIICTPSFSVVASRMLPYNNLLKYRMKLWRA